MPDTPIAALPSPHDSHSTHSLPSRALDTEPKTRPTRSADPNVLRCESTADFLAALPVLTGFTADNSIFLIFFSGRRAGRAIRVDLPDRDDPGTMRALLDLLSERLGAVSQREGRVSGAAVVICTTTTFASARMTPHRDLAHRIERRLRRDGYRLRELCCLAPDGWASYFDDSTPATGRPLRAIAESPINRYIADDPQLRAKPITSLDALAELPSVEAGRRASIAAALDGPHLPGPDEPSPLLSGLGSLTDEATVRADATRFESSFDRTDAGPPSDTVHLVRALASRERWFVLLLTALAPAAVVPDLCSGLPGDNRHHLTLDIDGEPANSPNSGWSVLRMVTNLPLEALDFDRLRQATSATADLAATVSGRWRVGPLALLALLWWLRGIHSAAERHLDRVRDAPSELGDVTHMVDRIVREYAPPGW